MWQSAGVLPGPFPGPVCLIPTQSGKLPVLFQLCFPVSRLVPQVVLWVSGTPGASPAGEITTELTRSDPLGGPAQAWLRQGTGNWGPAPPPLQLTRGNSFGVGLSRGRLQPPEPRQKGEENVSCFSLIVTWRHLHGAVHGTCHMGQKSPRAGFLFSYLGSCDL